MMGWNDTGSWGASHWLVMILMMIVVWGLLVAGVLWVVRIVRPDRPGQTRADLLAQSADDVLAQRFARGEINGDEFQRRRDLLRTPTTTS